jgi:hypothetical protein
LSDICKSAILPLLNIFEKIVEEVEKDTQKVRKTAYEDIEVQ